VPLIEQLNPKFLLTRRGKPRHVDSCRPQLLEQMREHMDEYLLEFAIIKAMKNCFVPPVMLEEDAPWHSYSSKRFTVELEPIHYVNDDDKVIEAAWSTKHNYRRLVGRSDEPGAFRSASPPISSDHLWAKLLLGTFALGVMYGAAEELPCLLIDIDFREPLGATVTSLLEMTTQDRSALMDALGQALHRVEGRLQMKLHPHWMASGGMGCWLHLFFDSPCSSGVGEGLLKMIEEELPLQAGPYLIKLCGSNLKNAACRMPLSRHVKTGMQAVYLDPADWNPYRDQLQHLLLLENEKVDTVALRRSLNRECAGTGGAEPLRSPALYTAPGRRGEGWAEGSKASRGSTPPPPPTEVVDAFGPSLSRWTVAEARRKAEQGEQPTLRRRWTDYLPNTIPCGQAHELLIGHAAQARCLAAMIEEGLFDPERPHETFPWKLCMTEYRQRLEGDSEEVQARTLEIEGRIRQHLKQMSEGWRPHLPPAMSREEWEHAEVLARAIIKAKPESVKRRGSAGDMADVLRYLAIKARGERLSFTSERAIRHLGWVGWDLDEDDRAVDAARKRLERILTWLTEGTERQGQLSLPPLLRRERMGYRRRDMGHSAPSKYVVLWENWGEAFLGRQIATDTGNDPAQGNTTGTEPEEAIDA
jgi:hypothetical protein